MQKMIQNYENATVNNYPSEIHNETSDIVLVVMNELSNGNVVIVTGGTCTGKSWLINQICGGTAVVDKKLFALNGAVANVRITAVDRWNARTGEHIAIDEAQLFAADELIQIVGTTLSVKKGILIASQQESNIPFELNALANQQGVALKHFRFLQWDYDRKQPIWKMEDGPN